MLVACRLAGLCALEAHYAGIDVRPHSNKARSPEAASDSHQRAAGIPASVLAN
jgi:hypothetical protein